MLDEESHFPKGTDQSFLEKLNQQVKAHAFYVVPKLIRDAYGVRHYAGEVIYSTIGFLEKNR